VCLYTFRRAYESGAFLQLDLIGSDAFGRQAKDRGIDLWFGTRLRENLEALDEAGALCPVAFVDPSSSHEYVFREILPFRAWETYAVQNFGTRTPRAMYSAWQLIYLKQAVRGGEVT